MNHRHLQVYFFLAIFMSVLGMAYLVFKPFLTLIIFAGILAILSRPIFRRLLKYFKGHRGLASGSTVFLTLLIVLIPLSFVVISLSVEAVQLFNYLRTEVDFSEIQNSLSVLVGQNQAVEITQRLALAINDVASYIQPVVSNLTSSVLAIFSNTVQAIFSLIIILFVMYYILKDGKELKTQLLDLSPLDDKIDERLLKRIHDAVTAVAYGEFVVAILKGIIGALVFLVLSLPSPIFWGTIIGFSHLIPGIGTALVTIPFAIWLFLTGQYVVGIIFTIIAVAIIGLVDNFIAPQLIGNKIHLHPLLILLSLLGGVLTFGAVGLFFGPIIVAVMMALIDIYRTEFRIKVKQL